MLSQIDIAMRKLVSTKVCSEDVWGLVTSPAGGHEGDKGGGKPSPWGIGSKEEGRKEERIKGRKEASTRPDPVGQRTFMKIHRFVVHL